MFPLYSVAQSRDADIYASEVLHISGAVLMENAGRSIFEAIQKEYSVLPGEIITVLCGRGNNGGDGYVLARYLANFGCRVNAVLCFDGKDITGDAAENLRIIKSLQFNIPRLFIMKYSDENILSEIRQSRIIVDAMLGTGVNGEIKEPYKSIVNSVNEIDAIKISVDLPTGLDADTGWGCTVFKADYTVTMAALKKGLFFGHGKTCAGKVVTGEIGIGNEFFNRQETDSFLIEKKDIALNLPQKENYINKYSAGKVLIIAGSAAYSGAAVLTASASLRTGAGAAVLCFPDSVKSVIQIKLTEEVVLGYKDKGKGYLVSENIKELKEKIQWADVIALGPGLGRELSTAEAVESLINELSGRQVVLDADGIHAISENRFKSVNLKGFVLTPHYKEFADLIGISVSELEKDPMRFGKMFAAMTGAYLVLKGAPTVIFAPDKKCYINSAGNPGMAKFGTGDVLTGIIAAFIAQSGNILESVINSVYLHSYAADLAVRDKTEYGLAASDIINYFPAAVKMLNK